MAEKVGITDIDINTGVHLHRPELTFALVHRLNNHFKGKPSIGIEVYPTSVWPSPLWPFNISASRIREWQQEYPNAPVSRVHLEFDADWEEKLSHLTYGGLASRVRSAAFISLFPTVVQRKGLMLAQELEVGVNIHGNIGAYFDKHDLWAEFKKDLPFTLIENGVREVSLHNPAVHGLTDAVKLAETMVGDGKADGLLLGVDHIHEINGKPLPYKKKDEELYEQDPVDILGYKVIQNTMRAMHITNDHHGIILPGDKTYEKFFAKLAVTPHKHPELRAAFDYSPTALRKYSPDEQFEVMKDTIIWIMDVQKRAQAA